MRKALALAAAAAMLAACGTQETRVLKKIDENGVEVVLNGLRPLGLKGEPVSLNLEEELTIDTESAKVAEAGLGDIGSFAVDSDGNMYFAAMKAGQNTIIKFDRGGRPAGSFGRKGQGPGEIQGISALFITDKNEVAVTNEGNNRLTVFDPTGSVLREVPMVSNFMAVVPLPNDRYFIWDRVPVDKPGVLFEFPMTLAGPDLKTLNVLDSGILENPLDGERLLGTYHIQSWSISGNRIFTGHQDRGYDIFVFDLEGRPVRKIRKEYTPVPVPEVHKKEFLKQFDSPQFRSIIPKVYFPEGMPPFIGFTSDEAGRLYVMTYETAASGAPVFDIFNAEGALVLRKPIDVFQSFFGIYARVRGGRFYAVQEKASGYKILKVYRMTWS